VVSIKVKWLTFSIIYYIHLLEELGELLEALSVLDTSSKSRAIVDRTAVLEIRGIFYSPLEEPIVKSFLLARLLWKQNPPEAEEAWRALIDHNTDSYEYYRGYLKYRQWCAYFNIFACVLHK
jgi:N-alpha-acetyltransferase 15/16, NatA auxiliary subunit